MHTQAYDTLATVPTINTVADNVIDATELAAGGIAFPQNNFTDPAATITVMTEPNAGSLILCFNPTTVTTTCTGTMYPATIETQSEVETTDTTWTVPLTTSQQINDLPKGNVTLTAIVTDKAGNVAVSTALNIKVGEATANMVTPIVLPSDDTLRHVALPLGYVTLPVNAFPQVSEQEPEAATDTPLAGTEFVFAVDIALTDADRVDLTLTMPATVCLPTSGVPSEREAVLYHYDASDSPPWTDLSSDSDSTRDGFVCGETTTFSPFAVGYVRIIGFDMPISDQIYTVGIPVSVILPAATDGGGDLTYTLTPTASIPNGLSFDPATRTLAGTPDEATTAVTLAYTVTDADARTITATFTLTVVPLRFDTRTIPAPDLAYTWLIDAAITPLTLPPAIAATSLIYTLTPTESIPNGLSFDAIARTLAGTPDEATTAVALTYTATDGDGMAVTATFTVTVASLFFDTSTIAAPDSAYTYPVGTLITPLTLPSAMSTATALTYTLTPTASIPVGLTFDATARTLSGTPTTATAAVTLTYAATDGDGMAVTAVFMVTVTPFSFDTSTIPAPDSAYTYPIDKVITSLTLPPASGGATPLTYTLTPTASIPVGLTFDATARTLSGTPTEATAAATLTYTVTDANAETITATFTLTVTPFSFDTSTIPAPDSAYTYPIDKVITSLTLPPASGGATPLTYTLTPTASIPVGLTFDATARTLSGTPTEATAAALTYTVTDANAETITATFTLTVTPFSFDTSTIAAPDPAYTYLIGMAITSLTLPPASGGATPLIYTLTPTASIPVGLTFDATARTLSGTPTEATAAVTLTYTVTDANAETITATFTLTVESDTDTNTNTTTRLNEQILTRASQAMTASTLEAVARRVDAVAGGTASTAVLGATPALAYQFGGQSSLRELLKSHGKAMLEDQMEYEQLFDGASFVVPLSAAEGGTGDGKSGAGALSLWGSSDFINLDSDNDGLDWDGQVTSINVGVDKLLGEKMLAGFALSSNQSSFDYVDADADSDDPYKQGEYHYSNTILHPYIGWFPGEDLKLWASLGFGSGEIEIDTEGNASSTDTTQQSLSGGFSRRLLHSTKQTSGNTTTLNLKGDVSMTSVDVEENMQAGFAAQDVGSTRLRVLVSGQQQRQLANGGGLSPSVEAGIRYDGGDGATGGGIEIGGGLRYANPGGNLSIAGNVRTLLAGDYDESGMGFLLQLSPPAGRGLSFSLRPVWGKTGSAAERLWDDGAGEITAGDTTLQGSVDSEIGYGLAATMVGSPGVLTPYTGITAQDGGSSRLRLGGRFAGGNGLSLNLEGARENAADGASHQALLRGEVAF